MQRKKLYEKISAAIDIPQDIIANIPVIIIRGRHEIEVSGCCGILEYENETVVLSMGKERFRVRGEALTLSDFREDTLYIRGSISSAEYVEDQNGV